MATKKPAPDYSESSIRVLKGLEPVKQRPGMYTRTENPLHIIQEVIDNASDGAELDENHLICSTYHMIWNREIHVDLARPLTWTTVITS